jgi:beta-aspartyl-peptidase (threonine type)
VDLLRAHLPPEEAARGALRAMLQRLGPTNAGVILVDRFGQLGLARTTRTMTWAAAGELLDPVAGT